MPMDSPPQDCKCMFVMIGDPAFCDSPSQTDLSHPVPRFITRDNIRCFHRATTATSSDEYVIGDIHVQADSLGVPVAFLKLKAHHYGRTPSPCAGRATKRAAVAAGATSSNRRQISCRNRPPIGAANCRRWPHFVGDLIRQISICLNSVTIPLNSPTAR